MPNRIIRESICTSGSIDRLSWFEEVLFLAQVVGLRVGGLCFCGYFAVLSFICQQICNRNPKVIRNTPDSGIGGRSAFFPPS